MLLTVNPPFQTAIETHTHNNNNNNKKEKKRKGSNLQRIKRENNESALMGQKKKEETFEMGRQFQDLENGIWEEKDQRIVYG